MIKTLTESIIREFDFASYGVDARLGDNTPLYDTAPHTWPSVLADRIANGILEQLAEAVADGLKTLEQPTR